MLTMVKEIIMPIESTLPHRTAERYFKEVRYIGVDGCKAGWFAVGFSESRQYDTGVFSGIQDLVEKYKGDRGEGRSLR